MPRVRDAESIGSDGLDEAVSRFDHQSAVAIDQARLAVDVDLREAEFVVADDAIARRYDLAAVLVDEAIEAACADGGAPVGECADPVVARRHGNTSVAAHRAAEAVGKGAHRKREGQRLFGTGPAMVRNAVAGELRFEDGFAGRCQFNRSILRLNG
nr:hypothetical protein [Bradyrhizobium sp. CCBAU 51753]